MTEANDTERGLSKKGIRDLKMMSSFVSLINLTPDIILSSSSLRTQITADALAKSIDYKKQIFYMNELYMAKPSTILNILALQEDEDDEILIVGHNPSLTELANTLIGKEIKKLSTLGIVSIKLDISSWIDIEDTHGKLEFYIYPKQLKHYLPKKFQKFIDDNQ